MNEPNITKETFQKLFDPLQVKGKEIRYYLELESRSVRYIVTFTKREGSLHMQRARGWLVSKMKPDDWTIRKTTTSERDGVIEFCKQELGVA